MTADSPGPDGCEWLAQHAGNAIRPALDRIKFNGEPYPADVWVAALADASDNNPTRAAEYGALIARIRAMVPQ